MVSPALFTIPSTVILSNIPVTNGVRVVPIAFSIFALEISVEPAGIVIYASGCCLTKVVLTNAGLVGLVAAVPFTILNEFALTDVEWSVSNTTASILFNKGSEGSNSIL